MNENFMKEKPVFPLLVSMALPMVISMLVNSLYNIVDSFFVAQISEDAMTALSLVYPVQNFVNAVAIGFGIGLNAVISYYLGAGDKKAAGCAATQGLALTMLHAVILTIGSLLVIERFLRMFSSSETVIDLGVRYSRIIFLFTIAIMANQTDDLVDILRFGTYHDDRNVVRLPDAAAHRNTVHIRHHHIEQHQVDFFLLQNAESLFCTVRF